MTVEMMTATGVAALPRVNLLPPEIAERRRQRVFKMALGAAGVASLAVVGLLYAVEHGHVTSAGRQLSAAQAEQATLQGQLARYANVDAVYKQVSQMQTTLVAAMGPEIQWSHYLNDLSLVIPDGVWLTSVTAAENTSPSRTTTATSVVPTGIGTVTFSGTALTHDSVAGWLDALAKEHGFTYPYFSNSTESKIGTSKVVNFTSNVVLTQQALSGRAASMAGR